MNILILSDTHGYLDDQVLRHASEADQVWHAGDIGNEQVTQQLSSRTSLRAVYGNIDGQALRKMFRESLLFEEEGLKILMTHIGGYPGNYAKGVKEQIRNYRPQIFVCGHSHILRISRDQELGGVLCVNPGAVGISGFHQNRTMVRMKIETGAIQSVEVIDLGPKQRKAT